MVESNTLKEEQEQNSFVPDKIILFLLGQSAYNKCHVYREKLNKVVQIQPDVVDKNGDPLCWKDCETIRNVLKQFGFKDDGQLEEYIFNDDATKRTLATAMMSIKKKMMNNPVKKYLVIYVIAGYGCIEDGQQTIALNEYNCITGFYKLFPMEAQIRQLASDYPNSYHISIFACCRDILTKKHGGGYSTKEDASVAQFKKRLAKGFLDRIKQTEYKLLIQNHIDSEETKHD